jgi:hypothetical protein
MSVYIDDFRAAYHGMLMSHMVADTREELDTMADKIDVARKWIQKEGTRWEHYDVCRTKRNLAIKAGAIEVSTKDIAKLSIAKKK